MAKFWKFLLYVLLIFVRREAMTLEQYFLSSYSGPYFEQLSLQEFAVRRPICAIHAQQTSAPYFYYDNGICSIYDVGVTSSSNSDFYLYKLYDPNDVPEVLLDRALNKPTVGGPYWDYHVSGRAVDGDINTQFLANTPSDNWWCVDLLGFYFIRKIDVLPHIQVPSWFNQIKVYVGNSTVVNGDFSAFTEIAYYIGPWDGIERVMITPYQNVIFGRHVGIQGLSTSLQLDLLDVLVLA
ncbi:hypothetical protein SK128_012671 [Halocaridina rubra]|uniref:F5/8 type C domain-containing protein n=1 Tax=Halocaridina rubra TaxID=373956 RepID=A0AAN8WVC8_HALRR